MEETKGCRSAETLAGDGCGTEKGQAEGPVRDFSIMELAIGSNLADLVRKFYSDPENVKKFAAWCGERGISFEEALPYEYRSAAQCA